jgi:hypothetical protein
MTTYRRAIGVGAILAMAALLWMVTPYGVAAQETPDHDALTLFARAHMAVNEARDEFHGKIGRIHDEEGRTRAREELNARLAQIFMDHELTQERYDEVTLLISLDGELRAGFEEILERLAEEG